MQTLFKQLPHYLFVPALLGCFICCSPSALSDNSLKAQQPQVDKPVAPDLSLPVPGLANPSSPGASTGATEDNASGNSSAADAGGQSHVHKLGVSTSVLQSNDLNGGASLKDFPDTPANHPFAGLRAIFGKHGLNSSLYSERDTGYGVCGLVLSASDRTFPEIKQVFPSMPAAQSGIQPGDRVTSINGLNAAGMSQSEVWNYFTGAPNSRVVMQVVRVGMKIDVAMQRMDIGHIPDPLTRAVFLDSFRRNGPSRFYNPDQ